MRDLSRSIIKNAVFACLAVLLAAGCGGGGGGGRGGVVTAPPAPSSGGAAARVSVQVVDGNGAAVYGASVTVDGATRMSTDASRPFLYVRFSRGERNAGAAEDCKEWIYRMS